MRPSKSRSRSKSNRSRSMGNIVNRVFDSSGPEGKVRGTPQQIIDKYNQLARDAQLANDRVATENFQQHAEHYARLLSEAQREQEARREQQQQQQQQQDGQGQGRGRGGDGGGDQSRREQQSQDQGSSQGEGSPAEVIDMGGDEAESTLVETPEEKPAEGGPDTGEAPAEKPQKPRRARKPRPPKADSEAGETDAKAQPPAAE
nr:DUF4167 domain-containing protein [Rhodovulum sp. ES.010]